MKLGNIKIYVELSQSDYSMLKSGAKLLTDQDLKDRVYTPESFLYYAIKSALRELENQASFNEN